MVSSLFCTVPYACATDNSVAFTAGIEQWDYPVGAPKHIEGTTMDDFIAGFEPDAFVYKINNGRKAFAVTPSGDTHYFEIGQVANPNSALYSVVKMREGTEPPVKEINEKIGASDKYKITFYKYDDSDEYRFYIAGEEYETAVLDMLKNDSNVLSIENRRDVTEAGFNLKYLYVSTEMETEEFIESYPQFCLENVSYQSSGDEFYNHWFIFRNKTTSPEYYEDFMKLKQSGEQFELRFMVNALAAMNPHYVLTETLYTADGTDTPPMPLPAEFVKGDVTADGVIDVTDVSCLSLYLIGDIELSGFQKKSADVDNDGEVKLTDLAKLRQYLSKKIDTLDTVVNDVPNTASKEALALPVYRTSRIVADRKKADSYSAFAASFSDDILLNTDDENEGINRVYSPISIYMATSMLAECCDSESLDELLGLLEVSDKEELAAINKNVFDSLYFDNDSYCKINNSIWIDRRFTPAEYAINNLADKYYAASFLRDLSSQNDCKEITKWISDNTAGKFEPEILPSTEAVLKIINTVIFKDSWNMKFTDTETGIFKGADSDIECQFMKVYDRADIALDEDFATYIKRFINGYEMNFVLPAEGKTVADLVSDETVMQRIFERKDRSEYDVTASVPKFSSKSKFNIIDTLTDIGVTSIFDKADLGPLLGNQTSAPVDEFVHEAVIDVSENGCEAAAYTLINCDECACPQYEFNADRPFVYFISNERGVPVFIGIVNDPTQK